MVRGNHSPLYGLITGHENYSAWCALASSHGSCGLARAAADSILLPVFVVQQCDQEGFGVDLATYVSSQGLVYIAAL